MPSDAVLVIGCGALQVPLIREAQGLGLYTIGTDANPDAAGASVADEFFQVSTYDVAGHRALAHQLRDRHSCMMCGCVTAGSDTAPTVAAVAEIWDTPRIPYEVAALTHDKAMVRITLKDAGLQRYQPRYAFIIAEDTSVAFENIPFPCVVKPRSNRASRGISIVHDASMLPEAIMNAYVHNMNNDTLLIEECLVGTEHSAEILIRNGEILWLNVVDRIFDYASGTPIELGHVNPTTLLPDAVMDIALMMGHVAKALDVTWGPLKCDVMMTPDGPKILEVTARLSGGWDCQGTSPLTGRHPMRTLLQIACGLEIEKQPTMLEVTNMAACAAILPQKSGTITRMPARNALTPLTHALLDTIIWSVKEGDTIAPASHNGERAGFVLASRSTCNEAWTRAKKAADALAAAIEVA